MIRRRRLFVVLGVSLLVLTLAALAAARPGGGQSYSGGSHSSGSGYSSSGYSGGSGSSGGGDAIGALIWLCFEYPPLGLLVLGIVIVVAIIKARDGRTNRQGWDSGGLELRDRMEAASRDLEQNRARSSSQSRIRATLESLRKRDPEFSIVLFEDFLYALYAETHTARGGKTLDRLAPWLSEAVREKLAARTTGEVRDIVVGALRYVSVEAATAEEVPRTRVIVELEANYSEGGSRFYLKERWTLSRRLSARSRPPEKARVFACPNCGAPLESLRGRQCSYCQKTVDTGEFDWVVRNWESLSCERRPPALGGYVEEQGTELDTVVDPKAKSRWDALSAADPALDWQVLLARLERVFFHLQKGWNERRPLEFRPYVSDGQFQSLAFWIDAYTKQGLRNVNDEAQISSVVLARVVSDAHYHAVTVRVFASGFDYTVDESGKLVGGRKDQKRSYSEYWTLIRGVSKHGPAPSEKQCPSCGAPLEIEMTGQCKHCQVKVTSGDFDWVLSRIEQDDSY